MLARKAGLNKDAAPISRTGQAKAAIDRGNLIQQRQLAVLRRDFEEVKKIDVEIAELDKVLSATQNPKKEREDLLAKVNERNRAANAESVRRAELDAAERKRKAWKAELSRTNTPANDTK